MKIVFYSNQLSERGTETALIDYATANQNILKNESLLAFPKDKIFDKNRYELLKSKFQIILLDSNSISSFENELLVKNIDLIYIISDGASIDVADQITKIPTFVHAVFSTLRKHGTYYVAIHPFLNKYFHTNYPVLPHIVNKIPNSNKDLRTELNIPKNAFVFGSYAGKHCFNIDFAPKTVIQVANENPDIYFIFMNIEKFTEHNQKNIIFLPGTTDLYSKSTFINTCNAMIHARKDGETFGLSIAEFSSYNKPIFTYKPSFFKKLISWYRTDFHKRLSYSEAHIMNLGNKGFTYKNKKQLYKLLSNPLKYISKFDDYDCFTNRFNSEKVILQFNQIISKR